MESERLRQAGKLIRARKICEDLLRDHPDFVGALHTLGLILADMGKYEEAATFLSKAVMLCAKDWRVHAALSGVNLKLNRPDAAILGQEQARALAPDNFGVLGTLAEIYRSQKEYDKAALLLEQIRDYDECPPESGHLLADCYEHLGQLDRCVTTYESMIQSGQYGLEVLSALAQMPRSLVSVDIESLVRNFDDSDGENNETLDYMNAMLAHAAGRYEEAWRLLERVNEPRRRDHAQEWLQQRESQYQLMDWMKSIPVYLDAASSPSAVPISLFILGHSRSGKTTLERLLGASPVIKRGYENPAVENAVRNAMQVSGCITRSVMNGMPRDLDVTFQKLYHEEILERAPDARIFTNTHPGKIGEILRFARTIQGSRFLFIKRNRDDLILRTYMKNYATGNSYAYDVKTIDEHITWYFEMIDLCTRKAPKVSRIIDYQDMIENPIEIFNMVGELCGIDIPCDNIPDIGDDREVAAPYQRYIAERLRS